MSSSYVFVGSGFYVASAQQTVPGTVRVKYSSPPKALSNLGVDDALNVSNYVLSGPGPYGLLSVNPVIGDPLSFDLVLSGALIQGTWTVTVSNVKTASNVSLGAPTAASFLVSVSATPTDLTAGAEQDDAEKIIRKHLNSALKGDNWNALIYGLSRGDDTVWSIAQAAYDQLFLSTASAQYLEKRSSDVGISKPTGVGINESVFRKFAIKSNANKIVQQAIREILEAFYGEDSLRAFAEASIDETYNLSSPLTLEWTLDETQVFSYTFVPGQFSASSKAKALEVAVQLTKYMRDLGSKGFAIAIQSPDTGKYRVRIYSGSLGLRSSVKITGGTAQNTFRFPTYVEVYSGNVTSGNAYTWVHDNPDQETSRFSLTTTGLGLINLSYVQIGDYVIIGNDAQTGAPGVYTINNVEITWSGASVTQRFSIDRVSVIGSLLQLSNDAYRFFRPKKNTTNAGSRTIVVSQSVDGRLDISIPATTQAVSRSPKQAFYARLNTPVDVTQMQRRPDGTVTIRTTDAHGLTAGSQVLLEHVEPNPFRPFVYSSPLTSYPNPAKAPISYCDSLSVPQSLSGSEGSLAASVSQIGTTNAYVFTGGYNTVSGAYGSSSTVTHQISDTAGTAINTAMEADGQIQNSYTWLILGALNIARQGHGQSSLGSSSVLVTGGYQRTGATFLSSCENLSGTAWLPANAMNQARAGHEQLRLTDGSILVMGGAKTLGTATNTVESFDGTNWTSKASMINRRANFKAVPLSASKILVMGGRPMGRAKTFDTNSILAQWGFNESSGTAVADDGATYPLTVINGATVRTDGKIDNCRDFNFSQAHATGPGNAAAVTTLTGSWTICMWFKRTTFNTTGELFTYGETNGLGASGADTNTNATQNVLINIGITSGDLIRWKWEQAAGSYVSGTAPVPYTNFADKENFAHLALRKKLNASGTTYDVELFINGVLCGQWLNNNNATGGSTSAWYIARNPELGSISGNGFQGLIDQVTVFKTPLNNAGIVREWQRGAGTYQSEFDNSITPDYGECSEKCEVYDIATDTWTETGSMNLGRAYHQAYVLADGRVLVMGGIGKDPSTNPGIFSGDTVVSSMTNVGIAPNRALRECEIYDPVTGRWQLVEPMGLGRKGLAVVYDPSKNELIAFGGSALARPAGGTVYSSPSTMRPEVMNLTTMKWRTAPTRSTRLGEFDATLGAQGYGDGSEKTTAVRLSTGMVMVSEDNRGRGNVTGFQQPYELCVPAAHAVSSGGLNGQFKVVSAPTTTQFTIQPLQASEFVYPMNIRGPNVGDYQVYGNAIRVTSLTRASNVVTATVNSTAALSIGDVIQLNVSESVPFPSGLKTVVSIPSTTTFTYNETGTNSTQSVEGGVSILSDTIPDTIEVEAKAGQVNDPGPYIFDPDFGVSVTSTEGTLAISALAAGRQYGEFEITVTDGTFPDSGYIVIGFGSDTQSKPIKFFSNYSTTGSNIKLIIDYSYTFEFDHAIGSTVTLLASRTGFQPQSLVGSAYVTGSSAGRTAAQSSTEAAIAAGIDPNVTIVYPGDRGLGGESYPTSNADKLSDAVFVWAGDDIDEEIEAAKTGD